MNRSEQLKAAYHLEKHPEGGWFSEVYTAPFQAEGRPLAGSIYFLLDQNEISHFHQIDCDEIWYYHEGCGLKITLVQDGKRSVMLLGNDLERGQRAMAVIPKGAIFAAENIDPAGYTFMSCATAPAFRYEGFRLVSRKEIAESYPEIGNELDYLAFETFPES
ncbi:MAG: cupin domain-containing protein [Clostridia bacterium]|nr:cupin domain-containing protein [Clostridia bacterium]